MKTFKKINFWLVIVRTLTCSYSLTLGIFNLISDPILCLSKSTKDNKNEIDLMKSPVIPFRAKRNCGKLYIGHRVNSQRTIVKRYLNNISQWKKSISVKSPDVCFT